MSNPANPSLQLIQPGATTLGSPWCPALLLTECPAWLWDKPKHLPGSAIPLQQPTTTQVPQHPTTKWSTQCVSTNCSWLVLIGGCPREPLWRTWTSRPTAADLSGAVVRSRDTRCKELMAISWVQNARKNPKVDLSSRLLSARHWIFDLVSHHTPNDSKTRKNLSVALETAVGWVHGIPFLNEASLIYKQMALSFSGCLHAQKRL